MTKKRRPGQPTKMTKEVQEEILERIAAGETLSGICEDKHLPVHRTVQRFALDNAEFCRKYAQAMEIRIWKMADEIIKIADDKTNDILESINEFGITRTGNAASVHRARLQVDTRKFLMAKLLPHVFGDKANSSLDENIELPQVIIKYPESMPEVPESLLSKLPH